MIIDETSLHMVLGSVGFAFLGLGVYVKYLHAEQLRECREGRDKCEQVSKAQQEQIDALIDGDPELAKAKRHTDEHPVQKDPPKRKGRIRAWVRGFAIAMVGIFMVGCSVTRPAVDLAEKLADATHQKIEAEHRADDAIKTSSDAHMAAAGARAEARAARALADERDGEAKRLEAEEKALRAQEIAHQITVASWFLIGSGLVAGVVAAFMAIRFQSKSAIIGVLVSGVIAGLGLVGLLLAPVWIQAAWIFGALLLVAVIVAVVIALHRNKGDLDRHRTAAEVMAGEWKNYANTLGSIAPEARAMLDKLSTDAQPQHVRDLITNLLSSTNREQDATKPLPAGI